MIQKLVTIQNLVKRFGSHEILRSLNVEVDTAEVVVIIGPSGLMDFNISPNLSLQFKPVINDNIVMNRNIGLGIVLTFN